MSRSSPLSDPPLPFPIKVVPSATGPVQINEIPDGQKEAILKQLRRKQKPVSSASFQRVIGILTKLSFRHFT
jgi:hypothetical protein